MTLYDYIEAHQDIEELPVHDVDYEMESYFYTDILTPEDDWDKAMAKIAKKLEVVEEESEDDVGGYYTAGVTVNLSEVIRRNLGNGVFKELFIRNNVYSIMDDIDSILSGNVSELWITDFADSLI